ncbi:MAG: hypothetical protein HN417_08065 [Desulfobacula sp.]|nr:hypothetical protein [Desulfobacula sp.]
MENKIIYEDKAEQIAEQRLAELIKEAGDDVRRSNKKAMEQHYAKIREMIEQAASVRQDFVTE